MKTVVARSCLPVGPRYRVVLRDKNEIKLLHSDAPGSSPQSPLEKLDEVLQVSYALIAYTYNPEAFRLTSSLKAYIAG